MTKEYSADAGTALPEVDAASCAPGSTPLPVHAAETFAQLPLAAIVPSLTNPRISYNPERLQELADSIKASGIHQPVLVRPLPGSRVEETSREKHRGQKWQGYVVPTHEIVSGERRLRASILAGAATIPAMIRALTDAQVLEIQIVENLQREDLTPLEEAAGYEQLCNKTSIAKEDIGAKIGKSRGYVYERMHLLRLSLESKQALRDGSIDYSRALAISRIPDSALQAKALAYACTKFHIEVPTLRNLQQWLRNNVMLKLADAPFNITEVRLVEAAGSCKQCPKRTGADPDIFADIIATDGGADICTDVPCYRAKESAHQARLQTQAEAKNMRVITGAEARELHDYEDTFDGYTPLNQLREDTTTGQPQRLHQLLDDGALKVLQPVLIEHPQTKRLHEMVPTDETEALLLARGLVKAETVQPGRTADKGSAPQNPADKAKAAIKLKQAIEDAQARFARQAESHTGGAVRKAAIAALQSLPPDACGGRLLGPTVLRAWLLSQASEWHSTDLHRLIGTTFPASSTGEDDKEATRQHIERSNTIELQRMAAISLLLLEEFAGTNATADEYAKLLQLNTKSIAKAATKDLQQAHDDELKRLTAELAKLAPTPPAPVAPETAAPQDKAKPTRKAKLTPQEATAAIAGAMQSAEPFAIGQKVLVTADMAKHTTISSKWANKTGKITRSENDSGLWAVTFLGLKGGIAIFAEDQLTLVQPEATPA